MEQKEWDSKETELSLQYDVLYNKEYKRNLNLLQTQMKLMNAFGLPEDHKGKCIERYYKIGLPKFIANGKLDDVNDARKMIVHKSCRDKILIAVSQLSFGEKLMRFMYYLKELK